MEPDPDDGVVTEPLLDLSAMPELERRRLGGFARWVEREAPTSVQQNDPAYAVGWLAAIVAADLGPPLLEIGAAALESILFDRIPATARLEPDEADGLVAGLRDYFEWLARQGDPFAPSCLELLDAGAVEQLACNLADERRWTWTKRASMRTRAE